MRKTNRQIPTTIYYNDKNNIKEALFKAADEIYSRQATSLINVPIEKRQISIACGDNAYEAVKEVLPNIFAIMKDNNYGYKKGMECGFLAETGFMDLRKDTLNKDEIIITDNTETTPNHFNEIEPHQEIKQEFIVIKKKQ